MFYVYKMMFLLLLSVLSVSGAATPLESLDISTVLISDQFQTNNLHDFVVESNEFALTKDKSLKSPIRVAQCRATCLEKFLPETTERNEQKNCMESADCFMCWENCELLETNFKVWGAMCDEKDICFPGCQSACDFHLESKANIFEPTQSPSTVQQLVMAMTTTLATWNAPNNADEVTPIVYVLVRRNDAGGIWRQIIQTTKKTTRIPPIRSGMMLRVLAVSTHGLEAVYIPKIVKKINTDKQEPWKLKENSLTEADLLVLAQISWEKQSKVKQYLVTWEILGGGFKGHLLTESTTVSLSLWPHTKYDVVVEAVGTTRNSKPLRVDTSKVTTTSTKRSVNMEETAFSSDVDRSDTLSRLNQIEILAGIFGGCILFIILTLLMLIYRKTSEEHKMMLLRNEDV